MRKLSLYVILVLLCFNAEATHKGGKKTESSDGIMREASRSRTSNHGKLPHSGGNKQQDAHEEAEHLQKMLHSLSRTRLGGSQLSCPRDRQLNLFLVFAWEWNSIWSEVRSGWDCPKLWLNGQPSWLLAQKIQLIILNFSNTKQFPLHFPVVHVNELSFLSSILFVKNEDLNIWCRC